MILYAAGCVWEFLEENTADPLWPIWSLPHCQSPPLAIHTALAVMEKNVLTTLTLSSIVQLPQLKSL